MRRGTRPIAILFCLCLLPSSAIAKVAIGFSMLPTSLGAFPADRSLVVFPTTEQELSLWLVNPQSMIGVGIGAQMVRSWSDDERAWRTSTSIAVFPSLTAMQIYSPNEFAPLSYQKVSVKVDRWKRVLEKTIMWSAEGEIGIGFTWRPSKKKISLSVKQGINFKYMEDTLEETSTDSATSKHLFAEVKPTRLLATFSF